VLTLIAGSALILTVLWEAFETIILPRRVRRRFRLTRLYYRTTWLAWSNMVGRIRTKNRREGLLSYYGPMSLIGLLAFWALSLVLGFGLLHYGMGSHIHVEDEPPSFALDLYVSGTTFFTLGLGDVVPLTWPARAVTVLESGLGFGFLAIVIGYLPVLYQSFSRREVIISMLDSRAGSPPTAAELLRRHLQDHSIDALTALWRDWEQWSAELLESHLSYPVLAYFRSQHDNQSWLGALTTILDATAILVANAKDRSFNQARLTFAMARHTVVDLSQVFNTRPESNQVDRLDPKSLERLHTILKTAGLEINDLDGRRLATLRRRYAPYIDSLARFLQMTLPPWIGESSNKDNWQTSAWEKY